MIDVASFTPVSSGVGGVLIGLAALVLYAFNGRVMGASGILGQFIKPAFDVETNKNRGWRGLFLLGTIGGVFVFMFLRGGFPETQMVAQGWLLGLAGLLVGFGTGLGSGCTSGHGICGLARFSARSLVAVISFMLVGFVVTYLIKHLGGV
ncbi:MAG: YeeE/YedE family protein [Parvibaculales bacterium]